MNECRHCRFSEGDLIENMIEMIYTFNGITQRYTFPDDKLDELLARADAKFRDPAARADEPLRYARALETQRKGGYR